MQKVVAGTAGALILIAALLLGHVYLGRQNKLKVDSENIVPTTSTSTISGSSTAEVSSDTKAPIKAIAAITIPKVPTEAPREVVTTSTSSSPSTPTVVSLPYSIGTSGGTFSVNDGWATNLWGSAFQDNNTLTVGAGTSTTGGEALLPGSAPWKDYTFQAILDWHFGESFGLVARHIDDDNYVACEFDQQSVGTMVLILEQYEKGNRTDLARGTIQNYNQLGGADISATIQVDGDKAACGFNYHSISTTVAGDTLSSSLGGGIGIVTWDPKPDNSQIVVKSIGVMTDPYYLGPNTIQGNYSAGNQG